MFFACPFDNKDIVRYFAYLFYFHNQSSNFYVIKYAYVMTCIVILFVCFFCYHTRLSGRLFSVNEV